MKLKSTSDEYEERYAQRLHCQIFKLTECLYKQSNNKFFIFDIWQIICLQVCKCMQMDMGKIIYFDLSCLYVWVHVLQFSLTFLKTFLLFG